MKKKPTQPTIPTETELLTKILAKLDNIDPPVRKIAVNAADASMNMRFVNVADVCYFTTDKATESQRDETAIVTAKEISFNNQSLKELEEILVADGRFMRTSKSFIVNLAKIRALKYSNARDLWFEGIEKPVKNAVTATYVTAFELRMKGKPAPAPVAEKRAPKRKSR